MTDIPKVPDECQGEEDDLQPIWDMMREPVSAPLSLWQQLQTLSYTKKTPVILRLLPVAWIACTSGLVGMFATILVLLTRLPRLAYISTLRSLHLDHILAVSTLLFTLYWTVLPWLAVGMALTYAAQLIRLTRH